MTPKPAISSEPPRAPGSDVLPAATFSPLPPMSRLSHYDELTAIRPATVSARWINRALLLSLILFALSLPHSIAAAQVSLSLGLLFWILRDLAMRQFHFTRTPADLPLLCFAALTFLSAVFSIEPSLSLPKLKALVLFAVIYLIATNLHPRGVPLLVGLLVASSLCGVGFSLLEKLQGRGMVIATIAPDSPLLVDRSQKRILQPGDVIWMIGRRRVYSPEDARRIINSERVGAVLSVEVLHQGDPVPVTLTVTEAMKAKDNPLGITVNGRSRQFRVSGFARQFLTYAEQMQMLALLAFGGVLASVRRWRSSTGQGWLIMTTLLFALFTATLVLTASRGVIASFTITLVLVALGVGNWRTLSIALITVLVISVLGFYVLTSARQQAVLSFNDDSTIRRISYMKAGLSVIPRHPLLGVGMDSHKQHWEEWGFPGEYITHTHSTPIQIAMERGLPALACYIWLVVGLLFMMWRGYVFMRSNDSLFNESLLLGAYSALLSFSLSSLTNYNFGDSEALMLLLFVVGLASVILSKGK
jgi:hypothetical protein